VDRAGSFGVTNYIIENIKSRRSVRSYLDKDIPKELVEDIIEAGRYAPSALNKQPWEFVVISDKKLIKELSEIVTKKIKRIYSLLPILKLFSKRLRDERNISALRKTATIEGDTVFYTAPLIVFIVSSKKSRYIATDCALAAENMALTAHSLGLGSCFIGRGLFLSKNKTFYKKTGLGSKYKIHVCLVFGYPKEYPKSVPQRRKDNLICWKD